MKAAACAALAVALGAASPVLAENGPADSLAFGIIGEVQQRCGFKSAPAPSLAIGDLGEAGSAVLPLAVDCNTGFRVRMTSANGSLKAQRPSSMFGNDLDYQVRFQVGTDAGSLESACAASALRYGGCALYGPTAGSGGVSSGDAIAIDETGALTIDWPAPSEVLTAGAWSDTLTIVLEARS
ncbi:hypothetical protein N0B44_06405 [Roseibacterium beibuensis]|uniref:hypothetical protein n=1 Tax=[Roseibacterium] beibuensis TaxID=1193142 RepID=UPI00217E7CB2|nr:hypothetical protein [Roseibacterium beibuensis]MCS6622533.1 hypothetical protein [Roseibacterium beibuensis]